MKLVKVALFFEILLGVTWTLIVGASGTQDWNALYVFVLMAPLFLVLMAVGVWGAIRKPEARAIATWVILLPVGFLFLPSALRSTFGPSLFSGGGGRMWLVLAGAPLVLTVVRPRAVGSYLPRFLFTSRGFNLAIIATLVLTIVVMAVIGYAFFNEEAVGREAIQVVRLLIPVVVVGACFAVPVAFLAYLGFFQPDAKELNGLRIAQLVLAIPQPIVVVGAFFALAALSYG